MDASNPRHNLNLTSDSNGDGDGDGGDEVRYNSSAGK